MVSEGHVCDVPAKTEKGRGRAEAFVPWSDFPAHHQVLGWPLLASRTPRPVSARSGVGWGVSAGFGMSPSCACHPADSGRQCNQDLVLEAGLMPAEV